MRSFLLAAVVAASVFVSAPPVRADEGDPAGWSVATDPRGRAFLLWTARAGGPRMLLVGCLRDVETFTVHATGLAGMPTGTAPATLTLSWGDRRFTVAGSIGPDPMTDAPDFSYEGDATAADRTRISRELLSVLRSPGPVTLAVGEASPISIPLGAHDDAIPIAKPLAVFQGVCFGK